PPLHFLHRMHVCGLQRAAVARGAVNGRLHLAVWLSRDLYSIDATSGLYQRQSSHDRLRVASVSDPGSVVKSLIGEGRLNLRRFGRDDGGVGLHGYLRPDRSEFESNVDAADLVAFEDNVVRYELF